jgi:uncharacterized protein YkwD
MYVALQILSWPYFDFSLIWFSIWASLGIDLSMTDRKKMNLPLLGTNPLICKAARRHSADMATNRFMDHNGRDGSTIVSRLNDAGYKHSQFAENVSFASVMEMFRYGSAAYIFDGWLHSPSHYKNIGTGFLLSHSS